MNSRTVRVPKQPPTASKSSIASLFPSTQISDFSRRCRRYKCAKSVVGVVVPNDRHSAPQLINSFLWHAPVVLNSSGLSILWPFDDFPFADWSCVWFGSVWSKSREQIATIWCNLHDKRRVRNTRPHAGRRLHQLDAQMLWRNSGN